MTETLYDNEKKKEKSIDQLLEYGSIFGNYVTSSSVQIRRDCELQKYVRGPYDSDKKPLFEFIRGYGWNL